MDLGLRLWGTAHSRAARRGGRHDKAGGTAWLGVRCGGMALDLDTVGNAACRDVAFDGVGGGTR